MTNKNVTQASGEKLFAANWLNFASYLPQVAYAFNEYTQIENWRSTTHFTQNFKTTYYFGAFHR